MAKKSKVVVVFLGGSTKGSFDGITHYDTTEKEGMDRGNDIGLPGLQLDLLKALTTQCDTPVVVVLINGSPLAIEWLVNHDQIEAIVEAWYPGINGGNAVVDVLFGDYAPAGRLPVTFYHANYTSQIEETNMNMRAFPGRTHAFVQVPVLFPFGYGLSYTTWAYSNHLAYNANTSTVSLAVSNVGAVVSDHSVLLFSRYVVKAAQEHDQDTYNTLVANIGVFPKQKLVAFQKVYQVQPGETIKVSFVLDREEAFGLIDVVGEKRMVAGKWELFVGPDRLSSVVVDVQHQN